MEIRFLVSEETINNMSVEDYEAFERAQDGELKIYRLRPAICRFMVDEKGAPVPQEKALKISKAMGMGEFKDFLNQFFEAMRQTAIPKSSGNSYNSPLEAVSVASEFPDGSEP